MKKETVIINIIVPIVAAIVGGMVGKSYGKTESTLVYNDKAVTNEDFLQLIKEKNNLEENNNNLTVKVDELNSTNTELNNKVSDLEINLEELNKIPNTNLKNIPIYIDGITKNNGSIAIIDDKIFYSEETVNSLLEKPISIKADKIYLGDNSTEYVNLLDTDSFYDIQGLRKDSYGKLPCEAFQIIKMGGNIYNQGFALYCGTTIFFNLKSKYDTLKFTVGHVDETDYQDYILTIIADGSALLNTRIDTKGLPKEYELDISSVNQISFNIETDDLLMGGCVIGIVDMFVK